MILDNKIRLIIIEELYWHGPLKKCGIPISETHREKFLLQMLIEGYLNFSDDMGFWDITQSAHKFYEEKSKLFDF